MSVCNKVYHARTNHIYFQEKAVSALDEKIKILNTDLETSKNDPNFYLKKRMVAVASMVAALSLLALTSSMSGLALYFVPLAFAKGVVHFLALTAITLILPACVGTVKNSIRDIFRNKQNDQLKIDQFEKEKHKIQEKLNAYKNETKSEFTAEITRLEGVIKEIDDMTSNEFSLNESNFDKLRGFYEKMYGYSYDSSITEDALREFKVLKSRLNSLKDSYEMQVDELKSYNQNVS